jgi:hypothetical protein
MHYILDSGRSTMRDNMDMDSDKSLQEELLRVTTGQTGPSESNNDASHKVFSMFF